MATLGTEESGRCRVVLNRSKLVDFLFAGMEKSGRCREAAARGGGGTLGISGWGCAAGTLEPLTYTRASSAEFCHPILE